ncbi:hypothetical protein ACHBTE_13445 [Streptomyces sp. M41]|uniref:hypothetical protein n=1 Tax=Streptomyces sp. M41 TaxID=3059412 RepID=UPI00374DA136
MADEWSGDETWLGIDLGTQSVRVAEPYARLVDELTTRSWLPPAVAAHAHARLAGDAAGS